MQAGSGGAVKKGSAAAKPSFFGKSLSQTGLLTDKKAGMKFEISGVASIPGPDGKKSHGNGVAAGGGGGGAEGFALQLSLLKGSKMGGMVDAVAAVKVSPQNLSDECINLCLSPGPSFS